MQASLQELERHAWCLRGELKKASIGELTLRYSTYVIIATLLVI